MRSPILIVNPVDNDHTILVTYIGRDPHPDKTLNLASVQIPPGSAFEVELLKGYGSISVHEHRRCIRVLGKDPMHQPIDPPQQP